MKVSLLLLLFFVSCGPSSLEDYKELGKTKTYKLISELQKIQNRDQLLDAEETLFQCFREIAELMLSTERYRKTHPTVSIPPLSQQDLELSDKLRLEMIRICRFDGGKEILEKIKNEALNRVNN